MGSRSAGARGMIEASKHQQYLRWLISKVSELRQDQRRDLWQQLQLSTSPTDHAGPAARDGIEARTIVERCQRGRKLKKLDAALEAIIGYEALYGVPKK